MKTRPWLWLPLLVPAGVATAQDTAPDSWSRQKCELYSAAWQDVKEAYDLSDTSQSFVTEHQDFINQGCPGHLRVCARTAKDIELANMMIILSMNEGMASTFAPFGCAN